jgi:serine/threonine-protein kinase
MAAIAAERNLLFGLLALQNGLINQGQLVAAFQAWTLDKARALADHLVALGDLEAGDRSAVEALVARHLKRHGGDVERSLAAIPAGRSTHESLARIDDPDIDGSLAYLGSASTQQGDDADRTASYAVGEATSDGQRFRVLRPHAQGGLGAVFIALDEELHREVALKQILDRHADDKVSRQRFLLEAEITGGLEHPGIVPVYGLGTYGDGRPYYAMRFIRGDSLKETIERFHRDGVMRKDPGRRSLGLRKLLRRFQDVCDAVAYAHSRGVLHRDLKPGNVMVGKHGETLVVDWGLAKARGRADGTDPTKERPLTPRSASGSAETLPGSALGTPAYMSPEQARGDLEALGPASDVYSLGATLYCLLTGRAPFEDDDVGAMLRAVQRGEFPAPRTIDPSIDRALDAVCLTAMATHPRARYPGARALAEDVERWMADEPVAAWREPRARTLVRWLTRHRTKVTAAAAAGLVALVGLAVVAAVQAEGRAALAIKNGALTAANAQVREANAELAAANDRERTANAALKAANAKVEARYNLAIEAIKTFHTGVSEDFLLKQERFKELRDRLLKAASGFYERLGSLLRDETDRPSRRALLKANFELAGLAARLGKYEDATAMHRRVLAGREALAREAGAPTSTDPEATALQVDVGNSYRMSGGVAKEMGRRAEALAAMETALGIFRRLTVAHPERTDLLKEMAAAQGDIAWLMIDAGKPAEALAAFEAVRPIHARLVAAEPANALFRFSHALTLFHVAGRLNELGRLGESLAASEEARAAFEKLASGDTLRLRSEMAVADCHGNLAGVLFRMGKRQEALAAGEAALAIHQRLAEAYPADIALQKDLARARRDLASIQYWTGKTAEALASAEGALAISRRLAGSNPEVAEFQEALAMDLAIINYYRKSTGKTAEMLASHKELLSSFRGLSAAHPDVPNYRRWVGYCLNNIGEIQLKEGLLTEAVSSFEQARAIHEGLVQGHPDVDEYQRGLAYSLSGLGQVQSASDQSARAVESFRRAIAAWERMKIRLPEIRVACAIDHARLAAQASRRGSGLPAAEVAAEADRAMTDLRRAVAAGYRDLAALRTETALDPLRGRDDFRLLMMDLAMPADPFAVPR